MEASIKLDGIEALIERVVEEKVAAAFARLADDPWLTSVEAAAYLGLAVATIHDLVNDGKLQRHGARKTRLLFRRSDLDRYVETRGLDLSTAGTYDLSGKQNAPAAR